MGAIEFLIYNDVHIDMSFIKAFMNIKYRGPDDTTFINLSTNDINNLNQVTKPIVYATLSKDEIKTYKQYNFIFAYHRLCINDNSYNASQPFTDPISNKILSYPELRARPERRLLCNGEIYNYDILKIDNNFTDKDLSSTCDVEIILPLYIQFNSINNNSNQSIIDTINAIDGDFAFILSENINTFKLSSINIYAVRDFIGIKPLYYIRNISNNIVMFTSEIKALPENVIKNTSYNISHVKPGTFWSFQTFDFIEYFSFDPYKNLDNCIISSAEPDVLNSVYAQIKQLVTNSIISRYNSSNKPVGILLSGGFDSSLIVGIIVKYLISINNDFVNNPVHLFTVGDSLGNENNDCDHACQLINYIETKYDIVLHHHIININSIEILTSDLDDIVYILETYEPYVVRKSIPFYYLLKYIKEKTNVEVLLTGDGMDELGGYNSFKNLDSQTFQNKSIELLQNLYKYDLIRTDRISSKFSLEIRQPYLNKEFIEYMLSIHPKLKKEEKYLLTEDSITKYIVRNSFNINVTGEEVLPDSILWRPVECLGDCLTNFELRLNNFFDNYMSDSDYNESVTLLINDNQNEATLPKTKEHLFYRLIFRKYFSKRDYLVDKFWNNIWI